MTKRLEPSGHSDVRPRAQCADGRTGRRPRRQRRFFGERAEGVISTAISVLIIAFLGIALWTGFNSMMNGATEKTRAQVEQIGN